MKKGIVRAIARDQHKLIRRRNCGNLSIQEVFGRPTSLPWGLRIAPEHRPGRYLNEPTFPPTFLYEGLWNLALAGLLVVLERRGKLRKGELFVLYIFGYALGRLWVESLRSDPASLVLGVRINIWMSLITGILSLAYLAWNRRPGSSIQVAGSPIAAEDLDADEDPTADQEVEIGDRTDGDGSN